MTIPNRKTVRSGLASKISTAMVGSGLPLQAVYGYFPKDLGGQSPVCTIETLPSKYNLLTAVNDQTIDYAVTFFARCDGASGSGTTAANAEDALDDLHYALCVVLRTNYNAEFFRESDQIQFSPESGVIYQSETHYVRLHNAQ